ncbi:hypothetical protein CWI39_0779p0010 [Hamiltosporidium magnivora]|uniref:Uncharacterized protein n=1 Tax=Hamiltosporidium magnivora TaxID=148818 RepID=A0A4V2JVL9_9MICR|nr:hypothetical protein CWI39_0779p0010 [Hamiltosporidium magnivora]
MFLRRFISSKSKGKSYFLIFTHKPLVISPEFEISHMNNTKYVFRKVTLFNTPPFLLYTNFQGLTKKAVLNSSNIKISQ